MNLPPIDAGTAAIAAVVGKGFIMAAETMPPPPADCGYWRRWFYDFVQAAASNRDKIGKSHQPVILPPDPPKEPTA